MRRFLVKSVKLPQTFWHSAALHFGGMFMDVHASLVDLFWCSQPLKTSSCIDIVPGRPFLLKEGGLGPKKCWLLPRWIENSSNFTYLLWKNALKTFVNVFFMFYSQCFLGFFHCQGVATKTSRISQNRWSRKQTNKVDPQARNQDTKPEVRELCDFCRNRGVVSLKWNGYTYIVYIYICIVALIYWCSCFFTLFYQLARSLFHVSMEHWLLAGSLDDSEAQMKQDCGSVWTTGWSVRILLILTSPAGEG